MTYSIGVIAHIGSSLGTGYDLHDEGSDLSMSSDIFSFMLEMRESRATLHLAKLYLNMKDIELLQKIRTYSLDYHRATSEWVFHWTNHVHRLPSNILLASARDRTGLLALRLKGLPVLRINADGGWRVLASTVGKATPYS